MSFSTIIQLFGIKIDSTAVNTYIAYAEELCPLHLSYFGLIVIGYICDVYWQKIDVQKNPGKFVLFAGFFPQMISGPIVTYKQMGKELFGEKHIFNYGNFVNAAERILWGAFKKLVVAERCAIIVNTIYADFEVYNGLLIPFAAVMFVVQLYADFSGLMDIIIGTAQLFGIKLPENFDMPFISRNLSEFWRRWHISLGEWLKDYVLFPIYRSKSFKKLDKYCKNKWGKQYAKKFNLPSYIALIISWFVIGLWHGGGWNYIFGVGLYMWLIIVISDISKPLFAKITRIFCINTNCFSYRLFQRTRTFIIYAFGLSFFRAESLKEGFRMWCNAFKVFNPWVFVDKTLLNLGLDRVEIEILIVGIATIIVVSVVHMYKGSVRSVLNRQNFVFRITVYAALFMVTIIYGYYGSGFNAESFIYGRF